MKQGLPATAFERLSDQIGMPEQELAGITGIAPRTLARRKREGRLRQGESERVFRLGLLFEKAAHVLGGAETARQWLKTPKKALGGASPLTYADTEYGAREVDDLLGRIEHGVFS